MVGHRMQQQQQTGRIIFFFSQGVKWETKISQTTTRPSKTLTSGKERKKKKKNSQWNKKSLKQERESWPIRTMYWFVYVREKERYS